MVKRGGGSGESVGMGQIKSMRAMGELTELKEPCCRLPTERSGPKRCGNLSQQISTSLATQGYSHDMG